MGIDPPSKTDTEDAGFQMRTGYAHRSYYALRAALSSLAHNSAVRACHLVTAMISASVGLRSRANKAEYWYIAFSAMSELCELNLLINDGFRIAAAVHEVGEIHAGDGHLA
jgi:hypothetical protein